MKTTKEIFASVQNFLMLKEDDFKELGVLDFEELKEDDFNLGDGDCNLYPKGNNMKIY